MVVTIAKRASRLGSATGLARKTGRIGRMAHVQEEMGMGGDSD